MRYTHQQFLQSLTRYFQDLFALLHLFLYESYKLLVTGKMVYYSKQSENGCNKKTSCIFIYRMLSSSHKIIKFCHSGDIYSIVSPVDNFLISSIDSPESSAISSSLKSPFFTIRKATSIFPCLIPSSSA